jgi:hypothetical protein
MAGQRRLRRGQGMMEWSENIDEFQWEEVGSLEAKMF